ncbi:MAG: ABC transporter ATP-binding protein [Chloroflexota bacterium]
MRAPDSLRPRLRGLLDGSRTLYRGLRLVASAAPTAVGLYVGLTLVSGLLPVTQAWLSKAVVDGLAHEPSPAVLALAVGYLLVLVVTGGLQPVENTLSRWLDERAIAVVDGELIQAGGRLRDLHRIERPAFGDELYLVDWASHSLASLVGLAGHFAGNALALAGLLVLLGRLHPLLPLVLAALAIPHLLIERRMQNQIYEAMAEHSQAAREMSYCARVTTGTDAAKEVRVFGMGDFFLQRHEDRRERALREVNAVRLRHLRHSASLVALYAAALGGGFWYVATQAAAGRLTAGDVALYVAAVVQAQSALGSVAVFALLYRTQRDARAFFAFLDGAGPAIRLPPQQEARLAPPGLQRGIVFRRVDFAYPESVEPVLRDVSLTLEAGKVTALVGHNGAGKSTLVKLLTRMYDPIAGAILLDGRPLAEYDLDSLRSRIGVVYQDFARFSLSLRDNIAVGAVALAGDERRLTSGNSPLVLGPSSLGHADDRAADDRHIERAAVWGGADEVAASLPRGYDTELTRRFEGGVELSGGQWQKVALARGFVRDAALVILDEPTSALDADAEHRLFQRFRALMQGRTALLISHRFSTVRMADHIVVLERGSVIEQGSHQALLERPGRYAELFEMQAGRYR